MSTPDVEELLRYNAEACKHERTVQRAVSVGSGRPGVYGSHMEQRPSCASCGKQLPFVPEKIAQLLAAVEQARKDREPVDRGAVTTIHGTPVEKVRGDHAAQSTGMHADYIVLTPEERAKGFVRPVRRSYRHVGPGGPRFPLRDLTPEEHERYDQYAYVKFEAYPPEARAGSVVGNYWTQARLDAVEKSGCGTVTTMGQSLAETYARDPSFYGATFCCGCNKHLPVGLAGEFVWEGTTERVGT